MSEQIKRTYGFSRIIIAIITLVIFNILFIHEDISWKILSLIFAIIAYGISYPSTWITNALINIGNKIQNRIIRILYYVIALPVVIILLSLDMYLIYDFIPTNISLSSGLIAMFCMTVLTISMIVPYVQTLIILIAKKIIKE